MSYQISVFDNENKLLRTCKTVKHCDITTTQSLFYDENEKQVYRIPTELTGVFINLGRITLRYKYGSVEIIKI